MRDEGCVVFTDYQVLKIHEVFKTILSYFSVRTIRDT